jgi:hypothetical protein
MSAPQPALARYDALPESRLLMPQVPFEERWKFTAGSPSVPNWKALGLDKSNRGLCGGLFRNKARNFALAQLATPSLKPARDPADSYLRAGLAGSEHPKPRWQHAFMRIRATSVPCMGTARSAGRRSSRCSGWYSHETTREPRGDVRGVPFQASAVDFEGPRGGFQNGKRVPIWKSRPPSPLCPSSCRLPNPCPSPSGAPVVCFPSEFLPASATGRRAFRLRARRSPETILSGCRKGD